MKFGLRQKMIWDALKKAGMTERQLDKLSYQNVKRVLEEVL